MVPERIEPIGVGENKGAGKWKCGSGPGGRCPAKTQSLFGAAESVLGETAQVWWAGGKGRERVPGSTDLRVLGLRGLSSHLHKSFSKVFGSGLGSFSFLYFIFIYSRIFFPKNKTKHRERKNWSF